MTIINKKSGKLFLVHERTALKPDVYRWKEKMEFGDTERPLLGYASHRKPSLQSPSHLPDQEPRDWTPYMH